jgi:hypothetical protein
MVIARTPALIAALAEASAASREPR